MIYLRIVGNDVLAYGDEETLRNDMSLSSGDLVPDDIMQIREEDWEAAGFAAHVEEGKIVLGPELAELKTAKLAEINVAYQQAIAEMTPGYPDDERLTFDKQEQEARDWLADNSFPTPFVDALAAGRQMEKAELVDRIIAKADAFAIASGSLTGQRQRYEDLLKNAQDAEAVKAIVPEYSLPPVAGRKHDAGRDHPA